MSVVEGFALKEMTTVTQAQYICGKRSRFGRDANRFIMSLVKDIALEEMTHTQYVCVRRLRFGRDDNRLSMSVVGGFALEEMTTDSVYLW
ncbi:hypothetical protein PoB_002320000 [Plakobranchus ocellatus]|uniref:Uncharacterized protein n=1 Tax=Plakobranchus ocellatus TaxID=259542 RepID=A0AAV3ZLZ5_9GAST|nr:hypothetical protein PoB_002320000 [Plakobranchus ocellatus]